MSIGEATHLEYHTIPPRPCAMMIYLPAPLTAIGKHQLPSLNSLSTSDCQDPRQ